MKKELKLFGERMIVNYALNFFFQAMISCYGLKLKGIEDEKGNMVMDDYGGQQTRLCLSTPEEVYVEAHSMQGRDHEHRVLSMSQKYVPDGFKVSFLKKLEIRKSIEDFTRLTPGAALHCADDVWKIRIEIMTSWANTLTPLFENRRFLMEHAPHEFQNTVREFLTAFNLINTDLKNGAARFARVSR